MWWIVEGAERASRVRVVIARKKLRKKSSLLVNRGVPCQCLERFISLALLGEDMSFDYETGKYIIWL